MTTKKPNPKHARSIRFAAEDLALADDFGIDINRVCRIALRDAIRNAMSGRVAKVIQKV